MTFNKLFTAITICFIIALIFSVPFELIMRRQHNINSLQTSLDNLAIQGTTLEQRAILEQGGSFFEVLLTTLDASTGYQARAVVKLFSRQDLRSLFILRLYLLLGYAAFTLLLLSLKTIFDNQNKKTVQGPSEGSDIAPLPANKLGQNDMRPMELLRIHLDNEIERATENQNDIGFIVLRLGEDFKMSNSPTLEKILLETFHDEDIIHNFAPRYYGLVLANQHAAGCLSAIKQFLRAIKQTVLAEEEIHLGYSTRCDRVIDGKRLFKESLRAASIIHSQEEGIIQFKPDLQKYKVHLLKLLRRTGFESLT